VCGKTYNAASWQPARCGCRRAGPWASGSRSGSRHNISSKTRTHLLGNLPGAGAVELAHGPREARDGLALVALDGVDHVADLVAARDGVVALLDDLQIGKAHRGQSVKASYE